MGIFDSWTRDSQGEQQNRIDTEMNARKQLIFDATGDENLDDKTKSELVALFEAGNKIMKNTTVQDEWSVDTDLHRLSHAGVDAHTMKSILDKAKKGIGVYGVRRLNFMEGKNAVAQPGRAQLASTGGAILGRN
jgi:hypothetical protein